MVVREEEVERMAERVRRLTHNEGPEDERHEVGGCSIHVFQDLGSWVVWLNTGNQAEDDGLCIGVGSDRRTALVNAADTLFDILIEVKVNL